MYTARSSEMRVADAARVLNVTVFSIYLYLKNGRLAGRKRGGHWYCDKRSVLALLGGSGG